MPGQPLGLTANGYSAAFTNFNAIFQNALDQPGYPEVWNRVCTVVNTNTESEQFDFSYFLGGMKKWVGSRQREKFKTETLRLVTQKYENSVEISLDDLEDNKTSAFTIGLQGLALDARQHKDDILGDFLNAHISGTATADYPVGFDGLTLFKTTHNWAGSAYTSNQSNLLSGGNTGKLDLTYGRDNIISAFNLLKGFRKPNGKRIPTVATHLVCSTSVVYAAKEILHDAGFQIGGTTTIRGAQNPVYSPGIEILELPGLTTGYWALLDCSAGLRPLMFLLRKDITTSNNRGGDEEYNTQMLSYGVDARYTVGPGPWWRCVAGDGT